MPFLALYPTGDNSMRLECHWFSPDWGDGDRHPLWDKRISNFVRILEEDLQLVPLIQTSMESPGFTGIQLGTRSGASTTGTKNLIAAWARGCRNTSGSSPCCQGWLSWINESRGAAKDNRV